MHGAVNLTVCRWYDMAYCATGLTNHRSNIMMRLCLKGLTWTFTSALTSASRMAVVSTSTLCSMTMIDYGVMR